MSTQFDPKSKSIPNTPQQPVQESRFVTLLRGWVDSLEEKFPRPSVRKSCERQWVQQHGAGSLATAEFMKRCMATCNKCDEFYWPHSG